MGCQKHQRGYSGKHGMQGVALNERSLLVIVLFNLCCGWWVWSMVIGTPSEGPGGLGYSCPSGDCGMRETGKAIREVINDIVDKEKDIEPLVNINIATGIISTIVKQQLQQSEDSYNNTVEKVPSEPIINMHPTEVSEQFLAKPNVSKEQFFEAHKESNIHYSKFRIAEPLFISTTDKELFYKSHDNSGILRDSLGDQYLHGVVRVIKNGWVTQNQDCGWKTDLSQFDTKPENGKTRLKSNILCPLLVPEGCKFRHFIDGTLPKIAQAMEYLVYKDTVLLLSGKCDNIVIDMLNIMGFSPGQIKTIQTGNYPANIQINTCIAPPFHPSIWNKIRHIIGVPEKLDSSDKTSNVILYGYGHLGTRRTKILNLNQVIKVLNKKFTAKRVISLKETDIKVSHIRNIFSKAKLIIGISSDLMYCMLFAPRNTSVLEIVAGRNSGQVLPSGVDHSMTWKLASTMGHTYWRDYERLSTNAGDVSVSLNKLQRILDRIEPKT